MLLFAYLVVLIWLAILFARGGFWRIHPFPDFKVGSLADAPSVVVIIPARDESESIREVVACWLAMNYAGDLRVIVVDDHSSDGTAQIARETAGASGRVRVIAAPERLPGWTGKLWAVQSGIAKAGHPDYFLFTDADIVHPPDTLSALVDQASREPFDMVSLMVRLRCESFAERALIPAFVFFFLLLYPPRMIADPQSRVAGAAGGCMLLRREALERAGGIAAIRGALIDDCALASAVKASGGRVFLAPASGSRSIRAYPQFRDIGAMIARSAFTQLRYSTTLLILTLAGLGTTYLAPALLLTFADGASALLGAAAWILMSIAFAPTVRYYRLPVAWSFALPAIALFYAGATVHSAVQYWRGRGGVWKGRTQAGYPDKS